MHQPKPAQRRYLTLEEVADLYGVSVRLVRRSVEAGTIAAVKVGQRNIRILESEAEKLARPIPTTRGGK